MCCPVARCEDGPVREDIPMGSLDADVDGETGCTNTEVVSDVGLCSGRCLGDRCPAAQCLPTRLQRGNLFKGFLFECDSKFR